MQRFWELVDRHDGARCWPWMGGLDARGRAFFTSIGGLRIQADRFAYELTIGKLELGELVEHACGNPQCMNPTHLRRSRAEVLMPTAPRAGRWRRGSSTKSSKLNEDAVRSIRARAAAGETHRQLAAEFGVGQATISRAVHRRDWKQVD